MRRVPVSISVLPPVLELGTFVWQDSTRDGSCIECAKIASRPKKARKLAPTLQSFDLAVPAFVAEISAITRDTSADASKFIEARPADRKPEQTEIDCSNRSRQTLHVARCCLKPFSSSGFRQPAAKRLMASDRDSQYGRSSIMAASFMIPQRRGKGSRPGSVGEVFRDHDKVETSRFLSAHPKPLRFHPGWHRQRIATR